MEEDYDGLTFYFICQTDLPLYKGTYHADKGIIRITWETDSYGDLRPGMSTYTEKDFLTSLNGNYGWELRSKDGNIL